MTELQKLKAEYPYCYYNWYYDCIMILHDNGDEETILEGANELIEDHYDGEMMDCSSGGNPEDDTTEAVTGKVYIEGFFQGDYEEAFNQI